MGDEEQDVEGEEGPPPGWGSIPLQQSQVQPVPPTTSIPSGVKMGSEQQDVKVVGERRPHGRHSMTSAQPQMPVPKPPQPVNTSEKGQMVCGSCHRLLSYPRGAKYVKCACCQSVNLVLEEHEVGQVKCGGCAVLLMYPYGAPSVKCSACHAVTEIGACTQQETTFVCAAEASRASSKPCSINSTSLSASKLLKCILKKKSLSAYTGCPLLIVCSINSTCCLYRLVCTGSGFQAVN